MDDFEGIRQRIIQIQIEFKLKDTAFARICHISHTSVANIIKGKSSGFDVAIVARICKALQVNAHWVITGEGKMQLEQNFLNEENAIYKKSEDEESWSSNKLLKDDLMDEKQRIDLRNELLMCTKEVKYLQGKIKDKEEIIELLKQQLQRLKE